MKKIMLGVFCATAMCVAAATNEPIRGLRVFTCGHSFHAFVPGILADIAKTAGIEGHVQVGKSGIGGSRVIEHWDVTDEQKKEKRFNQACDVRPLLREGKVDVLTLSPIWLPDDGMEKFGEFALKYNPDIRIFVQEFWLPNDLYDPVYPLKTREIVDHNAATVPALKAQQDIYCREMRQHLDGLNLKSGKKVFTLVPVGHAVIALREKIIAGQAPGLSVQQDLFRDNWGHPQMPVKVLSAYCFYACMYQRSPAGLPPVASWGLDEKLVRILQELAWDAVSANSSTH